jgi:large subunit ribosomal protein L29
MKAAKWRDLSDDEVRQKARELTEELFNLRFQISMGVAKNPARVSQARRDVARAQTILRQRLVPGAAIVTAPTAEAPAARKQAPARTRRPRAAVAGKRTAKPATKTKARRTAKA